MKTKKRTFPGYWSIVLLGLLTLFAAGQVQAVEYKLNVPDDFVGGGNFSMDLLAWNVHVDNINGGGMGDAAASPVEGAIHFSATEFDGDGSLTWGTSTLSNSAQDYLIGQGTFFDADYFFYMNGSGTGTLTDLGNGTGHWEFTFPMYTVWNNTHLAMSDLTLSTAATVFYTDIHGATLNESGLAMDYLSGDAVLVGQSHVTDQSTGLAGVQGTFVIQANDPLSVPEPSSALLIATGLAGLVRLKRRRR